MLTTNEIETLQKEKEKLTASYIKMEQKVNDTLINYLQQFTSLELLNSFDIDIDKTYKNSPYRVYKIIYFKAYTKEDIEQGKQYDWASDFIIEIFSDHIEINCGTCGSYTKEEKGLVQRAILIAEVWKHEQEIIDLVSPLIDMNVFNELSKINNDLAKHDRELYFLKKQEATDTILKQLNSKETKYLILYNNNEDNKKPLSYFKITKITPKSIYINDYNNYFKKFNDYERRLKKDEIICNIRYGINQIVNENKLKEIMEKEQ